MSRLINVLFAPEDSGGGAAPIESRAIGQAGMEELLTVDDNEEEQPEVIDLKPEKKEKKEDEEAEEKEKEEDKADDEDADGDKEDEDEESLEDQLEEDLAEPDEDKLEALVSPVRRREILAKYPQLFKDFPYLEHAYYREQKYTELYPTIEEATQARDKAQTWDKFEGELVEGDLSGILKSLASHDKNTFHKVADTILDTIQEIDAPTATHIYSGIAKNIIELMVEASGQQGNEGLKTAAHLVHQFLFGARPYEPHQPLHKAQQKDPRNEAVTQKEQELLKRQFTAARDEVSSRATNSIKATIDKNIDPRGTMTPYVKSKAIEDVLADVQSQMKNDKRFQQILTQLWQRAVKNDFNDESKNAIRSTVMSKAKSLLLPAIQKGRKTALGSVARKASDKEVVRPEKTGPSDKKTGKTTSPMNSGKSKAGEIPAGMSTKDYLLAD